MLRMRPEHTVHLLLLLTGFFLLTACEKGAFFLSGPETARDHNLPPFGEIHVNDIFDIELKTGTVHSIQMEGPERILENISFDVMEDTLQLSDMNSFKWLPDYPRVRLVVSFPDLQKIRINSPSRISSSGTLSLNSLTIISNGKMAELDLTVDTPYLYFRPASDDFGHYTFRGYAYTADMWVFGSSQLQAGELITENTRIRNYSLGDCHVHAENTLRVWLGHYGNIYYTGSPTQVIIGLMNSRGRLIRVGSY